MAKAPDSVDGWAGDGDVWFKVYQISAVTNGGESITFPAQGLPGVNFTLPSALPSGQYLVRMEAIALHVAQTFGGAQFYISCGQVEVTNGGSGTPGPTVAIPGVYTGYEPGILIDIYYPIPTNYTQPGPENMLSFTKLAVALAVLASQAAAHYTFPSLVVDGTTTPAWVNVRLTNNFDTQAPVTDVTSPDLRCYDSAEPGTATTIDVAAGQQMGIMSDGTIYHPGVVNVYMAKAPDSVDGWAGDGDVWFKVYQISAVTNGGESITFPGS
ncbi:hypothetical protein EW145_g8237, partial [Phellinidium pouzarii]